MAASVPDEGRRISDMTNVAAVYIEGGRLIWTMKAAVIIRDRRLCDIIHLLALTKEDESFIWQLPPLIEVVGPLPMTVANFDDPWYDSRSETFSTMSGFYMVADQGRMTPCLLSLHIFFYYFFSVIFLVCRLLPWQFSLRLAQCCGSGSIVPSNPYVFGPPGSASGSISQRYRSGSGSFYRKAKIVRKTLISTVLWLLYDFYPWKMM